MLSFFDRFTRGSEPGRSPMRLAGTLLAGLLVALLMGGGYAWGYQSGRQVPETVIVKGVTNATGTVPVDFGTFWQAWKLIDDEYLKSSGTKAQEKVYGAVEGLVGSLGDPHSQFFPPQENNKFQEDIQGNFGGIGAELGMRKGQIVIIAPLKGTPAERIGLQAGDIILKIGTSTTDGFTIDDAVNRIRGPQGTEISLTIFRESLDAPKEYKIVRATIEVPTLDVEMKGDVAYIQLYSFNGRADTLFAQAAAKLVNQRVKGIVLDLRNDPGGYLEVAVNIAGWLVPRGKVVVSEARKTGTPEELLAQGNGALANVPIVVLVNAGSASASEILAGALRDIRGVKLVGETSFGKGTVQQLFPLRDGSSLKLTIAHWVLPSGHILDNGGLKPDIEVKPTDDDLKNKRDPQLEKALETVRAQMK
jgi:carboxyl-terminal processing protease